MVKSKIIDYLNQLEKEGKITSWGYGEYRYWRNIPYIKFNGRLFLVLEGARNGTTSASDIFEFKTFETAKKYIDLAVEHKDDINDCCISSLTNLKYYLENK